MANDLGTRFKRIDSALAQRANSALECTGLTISQFSVLMTLSEERSCTLELRELERRLHVSHPTTTGLVKRLEAKGIVSISISANDARKKIVSMTDQGKNLLKAGEEGRKKAERTITKNLSAEEQATLRSLLDRIIENLDQGV